MTNEEFLVKVKDSFYKYLETGSRSNEKLKILHGAITQDLKNRLGNNYQLHSLGYGDDREVNMTGRYMDKKVDIAIEKDGEILSAIALKFIMRNYSQNSNNYFENMLGETANIRSAGKPYFQIVIIPSKVPYFKKGGELDHIETITEHNISKYLKLSNDNIEKYMHTPTKTLIYLVDIPNISLSKIKNENDYVSYYIENNNFVVMENSEPYGFGNSVIYNDYNKFIDKVSHYIQSI